MSAGVILVFSSKHFRVCQSLYFIIRLALVVGLVSFSLSDNNKTTTGAILKEILPLRIVERSNTLPARDNFQIEYDKDGEKELSLCGIYFMCSPQFTNSN